MKNNVVNKTLAVALSASMAFGLAACGSGSAEGSSNTPSSSTPSSSTPTTESSTPASSDTTPASEETGKKTVTGPIDVNALTELTISLPSGTIHEDGDNPAYDRFVKEVNEKTGITIHWMWEDGSTYYNTNELKMTAGNVPDVVRFSGLPANNAAFTNAAENGLFWDLTPYIDDAENYPNIAKMSEANKAGLSYYGKIYGLPLIRTNTARSGIGYRLDWLENLGLDEPTDLESFEEMLRAFTYDDPDGDGNDNTVGMFLDSWDGAWDIMQLWFGVPNNWGVDANGDLIPAFLTDEYIEALDHFRQWYQDGWINNGANEIPKFSDVNPGKARDTGLRTGLGGTMIQVLDDCRKVETYFEDENNDAPVHTTSDSPIFWLQGYVDTGLEGYDGSGNGAYCMPQNFGLGGFIAISTVNIKTEDQLRRALDVIDMLSDGWFDDLIKWGWEGETYYINDDGYGDRYDGNPTASTGEPADEMDANTAYGAEIGNKWSDGFNQVQTFLFAEGHEPQVPSAPASTPITVREQALYAEDLDYCVPDMSGGYTSETFINRGDILNKIWKDARISYITDPGYSKANLEEALKTWREAGGDKVIEELNEQYHAAGN